MMKWKVSARKLSWPNLRYHPRICLEGLGKPWKMSTRIAGIPVEIRTKHFLKGSQKHYRLDPLAQTFSVRWRSLVLTYIHKSCIWMACCPGVCSECAHEGMMKMNKFCHRGSICNGSYGRVRVPVTVSYTDNTWSNVDTDALALQQITPLNNVAHSKMLYNSKLEKTYICSKTLS
jgi:hypothetical protein